MSICKELHFFFSTLRRPTIGVSGEKFQSKDAILGYIYCSIFLLVIAVLYVAYFVIPNGVVTKRLHFSCFF